MDVKHALDDKNAIFQDLDTYPWDEDSEFKAGLAAILGPSPSATQVQDLTIRARCFYYSRQNNIQVDFDSYKTHVLSQNNPILMTQSILPNPEATSISETPSDEAPPYPTPFSDIVALITSGAPIPGIKEIPPTVLASQATQPTASKRRKPWEKAEALQVKEGTFGDRRDDYIVQDIPEGTPAA